MFVIYYTKNERCLWYIQVLRPPTRTSGRGRGAANGTASTSSGSNQVCVICVAFFHVGPPHPPPQPLCALPSPIICAASARALRGALVQVRDMIDRGRNVGQNRYFIPSLILRTCLVCLEPRIIYCKLYISAALF
jgi:hypothetical protein